MSDIDRAAEFYLRLGIAFEKHRHGSGPEHYAAELGSTVFEIYPHSAKSGPTSGTWLGFAVSSVDAICVSLEEAGVEILTPPADSEWGRRAVVADPDGHKVELTELG